MLLHAATAVSGCVPGRKTTCFPTSAPTPPTTAPTYAPTSTPTSPMPTAAPSTRAPTGAPSVAPTAAPTLRPFALVQLRGASDDSCPEAALRDAAPPTAAASVRDLRRAVGDALGHWIPSHDDRMLPSEYPAAYADELVATALLNWILVVLAFACFIPCCCTRMLSELVAAVGVRIGLHRPRIRTTYASVRVGPCVLPCVYYNAMPLSFMSNRLSLGYCWCVDLHARPQREWPALPGVHKYTPETSVRARRRALDALAMDGTIGNDDDGHDHVLSVTGRCERIHLPLCIGLPPCICGWLIYRFPGPGEAAAQGNDGDDGEATFTLPQTAAAAMETPTLNDGGTLHVTTTANDDDGNDGDGAPKPKSTSPKRKTKTRRNSFSGFANPTISCGEGEEVGGGAASGEEVQSPLTPSSRFRMAATKARKMRRHSSASSMLGSSGLSIDLPGPESLRRSESFESANPFAKWQMAAQKVRRHSSAEATTARSEEDEVASPTALRPITPSARFRMAAQKVRRHSSAEAATARSEEDAVASPTALSSSARFRKAAKKARRHSSAEKLEALSTSVPLSRSTSFESANPTATLKVRRHSSAATPGEAPPLATLFLAPSPTKNERKKRPLKRSASVGDPRHASGSRAEQLLTQFQQHKSRGMVVQQAGRKWRRSTVSSTKKASPTSTSPTSTSPTSTSSASTPRLEVLQLNPLGSLEADGEDVHELDEDEAGHCVACGEELTPSGSERLLTVFSQIILLIALFVLCGGICGGAIWDLVDVSPLAPHAQRMSEQRSCVTDDVRASMDQILLPLEYVLQYSADPLARSLAFISSMEYNTSLDTTVITAGLRSVATDLENDRCGVKGAIATAQQAWSTICEFLKDDPDVRLKCNQQMSATPAERVTPSLRDTATVLRSSAMSIELGAARAALERMNLSHVLVTKQLIFFAGEVGETIVPACAGLRDVKRVLEVSGNRAALQFHISEWAVAGTVLVVLHSVALLALSAVLIVSASSLFLCTTRYRRQRRDQAGPTSGGGGSDRRSSGPTLNTLVVGTPEDEASDAVIYAAEERAGFDRSERLQCLGVWSLRLSSWVAWFLMVTALVLSAYATAASVAISDGCTTADALISSGEMTRWMNRSAMFETDGGAAALGSCFEDATSIPTALGIQAALNSIGTLNFSSTQENLNSAFDETLAALGLAQQSVSILDLARESNGTAIGLLTQLNMVTSNPGCTPKPKAGQLWNYTLSECTPDSFAVGTTVVPAVPDCATDQKHSLTYDERTKGYPYGGCYTRLQLSRDALLALQAREVCSTAEVAAFRARVAALLETAVQLRTQSLRNQDALRGAKSAARPIVDSMAHAATAGDCSFVRRRANAMLNRACGPAIGAVWQLQRTLLFVATLLALAAVVTQTLSKRLRKFQPLTWHFGAADIELRASVTVKSRRSSFELFANETGGSDSPNTTVSPLGRRPSVQLMANPMARRRPVTKIETGGSDSPNMTVSPLSPLGRRPSVQLLTNPMARRRPATEIEVTEEPTAEPPLSVVTPLSPHSRLGKRLMPLLRSLSSSPRNSSTATQLGNPLTTDSLSPSSPQRRESLQFQSNPMMR